MEGFGKADPRSGGDGVGAEGRSRNIVLSYEF
jgi:hypothetical protein